MYLGNFSKVENIEVLAIEAANLIFKKTKEGLSKKEVFNIALSGGMTPKPIFKQLAKLINYGKLDCSSINFFFTDERWVSPNHLDSNYNTAKINLFNKIPDTNIFPMVKSLDDIDESSNSYNKILSDRFDFNINEYPSFDLMLLGIGLDGHVASLFPNSKSLNSREYCLNVKNSNYPHRRLTLSLNVLNSSRFNLFVSSGSEKWNLISNITTKDNSCPLSLIDFKNTNAHWIINEK